MAFYKGLHIPRGRFCYPGWRHTVHVVSFVLSTQPPGLWEIFSGGGAQMITQVRPSSWSNTAGDIHPFRLCQCPVPMILHNWLSKQNAYVYLREDVQARASKCKYGMSLSQVCSLGYILLILQTNFAFYISFYYQLGKT